MPRTGNPPPRALHMGRGGTNGRRPRKSTFLTKVRWAAPQAIGQASALGWLQGKAIAGDNGAIRYGYPTIGTRAKFNGYAFPGQLFLGYSARKVAGGSIRLTPGALPSTSSPDTLLSSPLQMAMRTVTVRQMQGNQ
jgi:hypothetical protein